MDKNAIKSFAIESRRQMIESVKYQASLIGITADGISEPISKAEGMETYDYGAGTNSIFDEDIQKRKSLVKEIENKGFDNVVEEVAYTWFNRIIAIRFMEVNDYLPTRTRVLSSETEGKIEPDIITDALELDLDYSEEDFELILKLKDENKLNELFRFLFIKQSNKLNEILPGLFEKTDDYMELLLNISFTTNEGIIRSLTDSISEEDFGEQVEIIGWLYQFYNSELKDETFANLKKRIKISKDRIPAATQLFTPDWIVKYMVENSVGRLWLEGHPNTELQHKWKYYVEEANQDFDVEQQLIKIRAQSEILKPEDILVIDPCMGSGHILVYVFDILMDIYIAEGYNEKDACESILKNNIYGLDIDKRAYQLAYFAVLMKAREYHRRILTKGILPLLFSIEESNSISEEFIDELISQDKNNEKELKYVYNAFVDAKEFGSILYVKNINYNKINELLNTFELNSNLNKFKYQNDIKLFKNILNQLKILSKKYDVVITNPPYMGNNGMNPNLKKYIQTNYPLTKTDLFAVFLEKGLGMIKEYGFNCMVTMQSWMFLSSFEKFRNNLLKTTTISNLLHMDNMVMRIAFGTSATVFRKLNLINYNSTFYHVKLSDVENDIVDSEFFNDENKFIIKQSHFNNIPSNPIAYWIDNSIINVFQNCDTLGSLVPVKKGMDTGDNKKFLRYWFEVSKNKLRQFNKNEKWVPYDKGGNYRKWYGNNDYVINWENDGYELKNSKANLRSKHLYFKESITWNALSSSKTCFRYSEFESIFDSAGSSIFPSENINYYLGLLNSSQTQLFLDIINPTLNYGAGSMANVPVIIEKNKLSIINDIVEKNIEISRNDWDNYELSWNFKKHPLIDFNETKLENIFKSWSIYKNNEFNSLKSNEIKLNEIFSEIYGININCNVEDKYISLNRPDLSEDIKSFVSYVVGCMFGRYSLDDDGIIYAGGNFNIGNYHKFVPDKDNIIPVLDTEYFEDDIVGRFEEFLKVCFGEETLEENLDFIAKALNKKGRSSREIIRNYFLTDFINYHIKLYKKCPIYWQFDSGKQNAFKCLIYMHRYEPDIVARVRTDYLHKTQKAIEQNLAHCENIISNSSNKSEISKATKDKSKYIKQLEEIKVYDEALRHIATQNIEIDLDDGVKVNYAKFQKVEISIEGEKPKKINLLKNI